MPAKENTPVATEATPQTNPQWTRYDSTPGGGKKKAKRKAAPEAEIKTPLPRARKGTQLTIAEGQLILQCTGTDPGLAFEKLNLQSPGPYILAFRLQSKASGPAELYWTTDAETTLPNGKHLAFEVKHDGEWHEHSLRIDEAKTLHGLRLDPCAGEGEVKIEGLALKGADGKVLAQWP